MRELLGRLDALDPDAGAALRVITYFDQLIERRAGLENVVRGAAVLSGHTALLVDTDRDLRIRVMPDGTRTDASQSPLDEWCQVAADAGVTVFLEHAQPAGPVDAMVLERAAIAAKTVLDRTRSKAKPRYRHDPALVEVLVDPAAPSSDRLRAARSLGLAMDCRACLVVELGGSLFVVDVTEQSSGHPTLSPELQGLRVGVGPAVPLLELPVTVEAARIAARFTASGSGTDPGPSVVYADDLGALLLLARAVDTWPVPIPDVLAVERAASTAPWMLMTLDAVANSPSLRAAATELTLHHSTLQERLAHAERILGWSLRDRTGLLRLNVALMVRRLDRNGATATPGRGHNGT